MVGCQIGRFQFRLEGEEPVQNHVVFCVYSINIDQIRRNFILKEERCRFFDESFIGPVGQEDIFHFRHISKPQQNITEAVTVGDSFDFRIGDVRFEKTENLFAFFWKRAGQKVTLSCLDFIEDAGEFCLDQPFFFIQQLRVLFLEFFSRVFWECDRKGEGDQGNKQRKEKPRSWSFVLSEKFNNFQFQPLFPLISIGRWFPFLSLLAHSRNEKRRCRHTCCFSCL